MTLFSGTTFTRQNIRSDTLRNSLAKLSRILTFAAILMTPFAAPLKAADHIGFWDEPRRGANSFNGLPPDQAYFDALSATGATWVRLTFSKWQGEGRDFLIGDIDNYQGLVASDLKVLTDTLDRAHAANLKVVIVPLGIPGTRWAQQTPDGKYDSRLWRDDVWREPAIRFWKDLAQALRDHPAIAAYNLINEPVPEHKSGIEPESNFTALQQWYESHQNGPRDLLSFYDQVTEAIRTVDPLTPVMVDAGWYADARAFGYWPRALKDQRTLYAFHMYEPYEATSAPNMQRQIPYRYPGTELEQKTWNQLAVWAHIDAPVHWAARHNIPANRLVAGEFGCMRLWADCGTYLEDVLTRLEYRQMHWAFYSFREDVWDGMDYELSPDLKSGQFYRMTEQGRSSEFKRDNPLFDIIGNYLKPKD